MNSICSKIEKAYYDYRKNNVKPPTTIVINLADFLDFQDEVLDWGHNPFQPEKQRCWRKFSGCGFKISNVKKVGVE